jgi:CHC2 zinc finger
VSWRARAGSEHENDYHYDVRLNPAGKLFHCFGCGERGDAFDFVQLTEGVEFAAALEFLADRYGVQLEVVEEDPAAAERRRARATGRSSCSSARRRDRGTREKGIA